MSLEASSRAVESTDGVKLALYEYDKRGPLLLVAHATGFHGRVYDPLLERLEPFRRVSVDLRGHGDAQTPTALDYRWESFADDLVAVLERLRFPRPAFGFGHSMGAACLLMVEQRLAGTFRGLFCYEPVIHTPRARDDSQRLEQWVSRTEKRRSVFDSYRQAIASYRSKPPYSSFDARALAAYVEHGFRPGDDGRVHLKCRPEVEAQIYRMGPRHTTWDALGGVRCPVLIGRGALVQPGPGAWAEAIAEQIPSGRLHSFEGLGHLGPLEDPDRVAEVVSGFFTGLLET